MKYARGNPPRDKLDNIPKELIEKYSMVFFNRIPKKWLEELPNVSKKKFPTGFLEKKYIGIAEQISQRPVNTWRSFRLNP